MTPAEVGLRWVRPPQQARSKATLDRLLDAAERLVAEKGFDDTGVAEVARLAGSSVGAFYSRFQDKDGLLHALYERWLAEATATADAALAPERWEGASVREILSAVIAFLVVIHRERGGLIRAFVLRNHVDPEFHARQQRLSHYISDHVTALLLDRRSEICRPDPERAAHFGLTLVFSALETLMLFGEYRTGAASLEDSELATELTHAYLAYLGIPPQE